MVPMIRADKATWRWVVTVAFALGLICAHASAREKGKPTKEGQELEQKSELKEKAAASTTKAPAEKEKRPPKTKTEEPAEEIPARPHFGVLGFVGDRALDFCDFFRFRLHAPNGFRGVGAKARATCLAQAGFICLHGRSVGVDRRGAGIWRERRLEGGIGPAYFSRVADEMIAGNRYTDVRRPWSKMYRRGIVRNGVFWDDGRLHPLSCGAEVQLFVIGVEVEAYPLELLDAAVGFLGLDPFNDDDSRILRRGYEWQTIPELKVRDESKEKVAREKRSYLAPETKAPAPAEKETPSMPAPQQK